MIHQKRRQALLSQLEDNALVIVVTNPQQKRTGDTFYPFRADSNFYYLTGFKEPESVIALSRDSYTIFLRDKDPAEEIWDGQRLGVDDAPKMLMADRAYSINTLKAQLPKLLSKHSVIYYDSQDRPIDKRITQCIASSKYRSLIPYLSKMRIIKDTHEIKLMRQAADISTKAHTLAMKRTKPGLFEYEIASIFDGFFKKNNAQHAYMPIVATGKNACILHYIENNQILSNHDLLLIDAGCEVENYACDITRTFPVNGQFSTAQKKIYQIVLDAQLCAIESIRPGVPTSKPHQIASRIIEEGLKKLAILKKDMKLQQFYMHGTGHWLGLDVHDVGVDDYKTFTAGMVTTIEPGIYIRKNDKINPIFWNMGIRIEDDVLVTSNGNEVLTSAVVKEIDEIEWVMNNKT